MKASRVVRIVAGPRPIGAILVVLILYCLFCLYLYVHTSAMGFYVIWDQPAAQIEQIATAGEWHDAGEMHRVISGASGC